MRGTGIWQSLVSLVLWQRQAAGLRGRQDFVAVWRRSVYAALPGQRQLKKRAGVYALAYARCAATAKTQPSARPRPLAQAACAAGLRAAGDAVGPVPGLEAEEAGVKRPGAR